MEISTDNELCQNTFNTMWNENLSTFESENKEPMKYEYIDDKAIRMMAKMGFQSGAGLGRNNQGILQPVELQSNLGRRGLGHFIKGLASANLKWDPSQEEIIVEEKADWLISETKINSNQITQDNIFDWIKIGQRKKTITDETKYCDGNLVEQVLEAKEIFDDLEPFELCKARSKANPFETLKSAFFMNRAALKMANIDAATGFMFTDVDRQKEHKQPSNPYYFADICAGPGGFSEYIFWRKRWAFKGFGMTLRGENDFKVHESSCAAGETFEALYGVREDGDVYYPENIRDFCSKVKNSTGGMGVHFVMADGGFSVEGQENIQEILSRQIYVCQSLIALNILRPNGHFVVKLFDLFTSFSVGLVYLIYRCFHKVAIFKPNSSRPANSERYLICSQLKDDNETKFIREYIEKIVQMLFEIRSNPEQEDLDINEIVPEQILEADDNFINYIKTSNVRLAEKQLVGLMKLATFLRDTKLQEPRQEELRTQCLAYWRVPDRPRAPLPHITTDELLTSSILNTDFMFSYAKELQKKQEINEILEESDDWHYTFVASAKNCNFCNIYAGLGRSKVYRFQRNRWIRVKGIELVRGSILFAELVKEFSSEDASFKKSLHVMDALRLGDISIADLPYQERLDLLKVYCQAVNRDNRTDLSSIRAKPVSPLSEITGSGLPTLTNNEEWRYPLNPLCIKKSNQYYNVNSLLLLKTDASQSFETTISSRMIIYLPTVFDIENKDENERFYLWQSFTSKFLETKK